MQDDWGYVVIWEFRVLHGKEDQFEQAYGPQGVWADFFRTGEGYLRTELVCDANLPGRYITLDFWNSQKLYEEFRAQNAARYDSIDAECEVMTGSEIEIGRFARVG
ncbi:MAG TPA: antibiotic biosynthesis monooxygenase [Terriglobales bacterium]|nr:antibiotic biosynthesis monooxygenase [Terriglobales bacterium]